MTIQSVFDPAFAQYGQVLTGYDLSGLLETLGRVTSVPEEGTAYVPEQPELMALPVCGAFESNLPNFDCNELNIEPYVFSGAISIDL